MPSEETIQQVLLPPMKRLRSAVWPLLQLRRAPDTLPRLPALPLLQAHRPKHLQIRPQFSRPIPLAVIGFWRIRMLQQALPIELRLFPSIIPYGLSAISQKGVLPTRRMFIPTMGLTGPIRALPRLLYHGKGPVIWYLIRGMGRRFGSWEGARVRAMMFGLHQTVSTGLKKPPMRLLVRDWNFQM